MQNLPVILEWHNFQRLEKALNSFYRINFLKSDVYFLNRRKKCIGGHLYTWFSRILGLLKILLLVSSMFNEFNNTQTRMLNFINLMTFKLFCIRGLIVKRQNFAKYTQHCYRRHFITLPKSKH